MFLVGSVYFQDSSEGVRAQSGLQVRDRLASLDLEHVKMRRRRWSAEYSSAGGCLAGGREITGQYRPWNEVRVCLSGRKRRCEQWSREHPCEQESCATVVSHSQIGRAS